jgi:hypothetical protein
MWQLSFKMVWVKCDVSSQIKCRDLHCTGILRSIVW